MECNISSLAAPSVMFIVSLALLMLANKSLKKKLPHIPCYFLLSLAAIVAIAPFPIDPTIKKPLLGIAFAIVITQVGIWLGNLAARLLGHKAIGSIIKGITWTFAALLLLDNLGFNVRTLIAGLGIGGIAIALAAQSILGDLFASLSIITDKPFQVGDFIVVDKLSGTVENIGLKSTRIRSLTGEEIILTNNDLLRSRIHNFKQMNERRLTFKIGVSYETEQDKLKNIPSIIKEIIERTPNTRFERSTITAIGDSSIDFENAFYVTRPEKSIAMETLHIVHLEVLSKFSKEKIQLAYPTRTIYTHAPTNSNKT